MGELNSRALTAAGTATVTSVEDRLKAASAEDVFALIDDIGVA